MNKRHLTLSSHTEFSILISPSPVQNNYIHYIQNNHIQNNLYTRNEDDYSPK